MAIGNVSTRIRGQNRPVDRSTVPKGLLSPIRALLSWTGTTGPTQGKSNRSAMAMKSRAVSGWPVLQKNLERCGGGLSVTANSDNSTFRVPDFREGKVSLATQNGIGRVEPIDDAQFERKVRMLFGYNGSRLLPARYRRRRGPHDLRPADLKALCQGNVPGEFREVGRTGALYEARSGRKRVGVHTPTLSNSRRPPSWSSMNFRLRVRAGCEIPSMPPRAPKCRCSAKARTSSSSLQNT